MNYSNSQRAGVILYLTALIFGAYVISVSFITSDSYDYIGYDIIDCNSGELYIHFYDRDYGNSKDNIVLQKVIYELNNQFEKMKNEKIIAEYKEVE